MNDLLRLQPCNIISPPGPLFFDASGIKILLTLILASGHFVLFPCFRVLFFFTPPPYCIDLKHIYGIAASFSYFSLFGSLSYPTCYVPNLGRQVQGYRARFFIKTANRCRQGADIVCFESAQRSGLESQNALETRSYFSQAPYKMSTLHLTHRPPKAFRLYSSILKT